MWIKFIEETNTDKKVKIALKLSNDRRIKPYRRLKALMFLNDILIFGFVKHEKS